jgi:hypothetical protein
MIPVRRIPSWAARYWKLLVPLLAVEYCGAALLWPVSHIATTVLLGAGGLTVLAVFLSSSPRLVWVAPPTP